MEQLHPKIFTTERAPVAASDSEVSSMDSSTILAWNHSIYEHPTLEDYYYNLTPFIALSMFSAGLLLLLTVAVFATTVSKIRKRVDNGLRSLSIAMCSFYPLISLAALITLMLPSSWLICHTVMHLSFTVGAVLFRKLCFRCVDSEAVFLKETEGAAVAVNTPPCCCCCLCLPLVLPTKAKLCLLRYMVWQMPLVQGIIMLLLNVVYYGSGDLYPSMSLYFTPFLVCSILSGIWALNIVLRMVSAQRPEYGLMRKMFALQLILLLCKLQYLLLDSQLDHVQLGGYYPINHIVYKQTIINLLISAEMVLVSLLAQSAYKGVQAGRLGLRTAA